MTRATLWLRAGLAAAFVFSCSLLLSADKAGAGPEMKGQSAAIRTAAQSRVPDDGFGPDPRVLRQDWRESERKSLGPALQITPAATGALSTTPELRLELGQHFDGIESIDTDGSGHLLVTGSYDKTARIWEIPSQHGQSFRLLQVLRPPIGTDAEGSLYAVAMSPKGDVVAAAGYTGGQWTFKKASIYIFEVSTGRLLQRLGGLPPTVSSLAFSPDGALLATGLDGAGGLRVYKIRECLERRQVEPCRPASDTNYTKKVRGLSFARDGRLATTSADGKIRLYAPGAYSRPRIPPRSAPRPNDPVGAIAFSPDQTELAVGYQTSPRISANRWGALVSIVSADALQPIDDLYYTFDGDVGGLPNVAWDSNGAVVYAAGDVEVVKEASAEYLLFVFPRHAGAHAATLLPYVESGSALRISALKPLKKGGVAFASIEPRFGILGRGSRTPMARGPETIDVHETVGQDVFDTHALRLAPDGRSVSLAFNTFKEDFFTFSTADLALTTRGGEDETLSPPRRVDERRPGWSAIRSRIESILEKGEGRSSRAAESVDGMIAIGTKWNVRLYDRDGKQICSHRAPGTTRKLNISEDAAQNQQRLMVGAFSDGTIRWYLPTPDRCAELLALYVTPEPSNPKWIAWIPEGPHQGYYATSIGAENLVGWHVNQAIDREALFYSVGKFRDKFYRPDIIARVLKTLDPAKALADANAATGRRDTYDRKSVEAELPPIVRILEPADGAHLSDNYLRLRYMIETPSAGRGPVKEVTVLLNGHNYTLKGAAGTEAGKVHTVFVSDLPVGESLVSVIAGDDHGTSAPAIVKVVVGTPSNTAPPPRNNFGRSKALRRNIQADQAGAKPIILEPCPGFHKAVRDNYVRLRFKLEPAPGGTPKFTLKVNGTTKSWSRGDPQARNGVYTEILDDLPEGEVTLTLIAQIGAAPPLQASVTGRIAGEDTSFPANCTPQIEGSTQSSTTYVLAIGVKDYPVESRIPDLSYADKDASDFYAFIRRQVRQAQSAWAPGGTPGPLLNAAANSDNVMGALEYLAKTVGDNDRAFIFISGHGGTCRIDHKYAFLTSSSTLDDPCKGIQANHLVSWLKQIRGTKFVFIDSCRSGSAVDVTLLLNTLGPEGRAVIYSASTGNRPSVELEGNGAFTKALLEGLGGSADGMGWGEQLPKDGTITIDELHIYLKSRVPKLLQEAGKQTSQEPTVWRSDLMGELGILTKPPR